MIEQKLKILEEHLSGQIKNVNNMHIITIEQGQKVRNLYLKDLRTLEEIISQMLQNDIK